MKRITWVANYHNMPCCEVTILPFVNISTTTIPYTGNRPTVSVSYLVDGVWYALGVATVVQINATNVTVTHGGNQTGVVRMVQ